MIAHRPVLVFCLASAMVTTGPAQDPPSPADLQRAAPVVSQRLAEWLWPVNSKSGKGLPTLGDFLGRAQAEEDRVVRYLLLGHLARAAGRQGQLGVGERALAALREGFGDDAMSRLEMLDAAAEARALPPLALTSAYLGAARSELLHSTRAERNSQFDRLIGSAKRMATRNPEASSADPALAPAVDWEVAGLEAARRFLRQLSNPTPDDLARFQAFYLGHWKAAAEQLEELPPSDAGPAVAVADPDDRTDKANVLRGTQTLRQAARWREHAARKNVPKVVRYHLLTRAAHHYRHAHALLDPLQQRRIESVLTGVYNALGELHPLHRLDADDPRAMERLLIRGGTWSRADQRIIGRNRGPATRATLRVAYESIDEVILHGGLTTRVGVNFRIAVGELNLIFNWECADENHCYNGNRKAVTQPRLLVPGTTHVIRLRQLGDRIHVLVDNRRIFDVAGKLRGTVTVYPAVGSELFLTRCRVIGRPAFEQPVTGPDGATR